VVKQIVTVLGIHDHPYPDLTEIADALRRARCLFRSAQCRQKHACQDRDDSDNDEQFDQSESS
jgi:hypothetical protein